MWRIAFIFGIFWAAFSTACTTIDPASSVALDVFRERDDVINLPYIITDQGLISISAKIDDGEPVQMIIDTGATQSAIYSNIAKRLEIDGATNTVNVTGLTNSGSRPEVTLPYIGLDMRHLKNIKVAVLESFSQDTPGAVKIDGIIGLDILEKFYVLFDHERQIFSMIPNHYAVAELPPSWLRIDLKPNPYIDDGRALKYFDVRFIGQIVPALFDTGSALNLSNWLAARHPQAKHMRRRLREDWELKGAIGTFNPKIQLKAQTLRSGQKFWEDRVFLVSGLDSLNILGIEGKPFIIAGADMFNTTTFWLDLKAGEIVIKPQSNSQDAGQVIKFQ